MAATLALVAAVVGPLVAYLIAARQFSGKIKTSDAEDLWTESRSIRKWSTERIETLNNIVERLERRVGALETSLNEKDAELKAIHQSHKECLETTAGLREKVLSLIDQLELAHKRIAQLEERNDRHAGL